MTDLAEYVLHLAGPMTAGEQRCTACSLVLTDETGLDITPGSTRYTRGRRVLILNGEDYLVTGPYPEDARLPAGTRQCTSPSTSPTKDLS